MLSDMLVILPPLLVLITAMITQKLKFSLILGLISGALIAQSFQPIEAVNLVIQRLYGQVSNTENMYVYLFLFCVGIIITIINHTGAVYALAALVKKHLKKAVQVERSIFVLSFLLGLDDYLNSLAVGYVLRPLADSFGITRTKFAYLVHTFAGPLVILIPISTWAAFITFQLEQSGISVTSDATHKIIADPFYVYLESIPFIYYALLTILTAGIIINRRWSFGPMLSFERKNNNSVDRATQKINTTSHNSTISDLFIPLGSLFLFVFAGMLYMGDYWLFGGTQSLIGAFKTNQDAFFVLGVSSVITVVISFMLAYMRKQIILTDIVPLSYEGISLMLSAVLLIVLASALGSILRLDLATGQYLADTLLKTMHITYVPVTFFLVAVATSTMIGTAWGTIALLLPIGIPMAQGLMHSSATDSTLSFIVPAIGAILAGATFGDHTSPISSAVVMSATSAGCDPIDHINTQVAYIIPPLIGSVCAFFVTGMLVGHERWFIISLSLGAGAIVTIGLLYLGNVLFGTKK